VTSEPPTCLDELECDHPRHCTGTASRASNDFAAQVSAALPFQRQPYEQPCHLAAVKQVRTNRSPDEQAGAASNPKTIPLASCQVELRSGSLEHREPSTFMALPPVALSSLRCPPTVLADGRRRPDPLTAL